MLTAIYDLAVSPPTYDFISFLVAAERRRIEDGHEVIEVVIVEGPADGFRRDSLPPFGADARLAMRTNIVEAACRLLPSCSSMRVVSRKEAAGIRGDIFPENWTAGNPASRYGLRVAMQTAAAGVFPLRWGASYAVPRRTISMTFREASYWPTRNTDRVQWLAAAERLAANGWSIIIVPDTESSPFSDGPWAVDHAAATDLWRRCALYTAADLNLFVGGGPAWMAVFMADVQACITRMGAEGAPCVSDQYFAGCGLPRGAQVGRPGHRIAWSGETADEIVAIVDEMMAPAG